MMSLGNITRVRESFREAQAEARERDQRVQVYLDERQRAQESPNNQLLVKATSENEAYVFTLGHGLVPGNIRMFSDCEALVRVHCCDITLLQRWFAEHLTFEAPFPVGTLLMWSPLSGSGVTMTRGAA